MVLTIFLGILLYRIFTSSLSQETHAISRPTHPPRKNKGPRINDDITTAQVRVIDQDGEMQGVMEIADALALAADAGLDLVEVSPGAAPPVCKVLDFGKYKYEQQKKAAEARKKQKVVDVKEVKIRPATEKHDYEVKLRNARRFLEKGDKVKVTMRFRGREMAHQQIGLDLLLKLRDDVADVGKVDLAPKLEGRQMIMVLSSEISK